MNNIKWKNEFDVAKKAAVEAGHVLNDLSGRLTQIMKKGVIDLVTNADLAAEKIILEIISQNFPNDNILSEEKGELKQNSNRTWIIDPLDGTTNFAHQFPFFAVSIALEVENEITIGIVYNPCRNEFFQAVKGQGAYHNQKPVHVSQTTVLNESLLATGFPYDIHENPDQVFDLFKRIMIRAQGIRRPGSAALDLCYVAAGILDGFWEAKLKPWDTAAGMLIVEEAGGKISTFQGTAYIPYEDTIIATNSRIHDELIRALNVQG